MLRSIALLTPLSFVLACGSVQASSDGSVDGANPNIDSRVPCGNGMPDPGEGCDNGPSNGPGMACNAQCMPNVCGDGDRGPGEACDNGPNNGETLGSCAPDCTKLVEAKHIVLSAGSSNGNLGVNPVATADSFCPANHRAMFAFGTTRRATTMPNAAAGSVDWVVHPWTIYLNASGQLIWQTRTVPLLGVDATGTFTALLNPIATGGGALTGLAQDWTTLQQNDCSGWGTPVGGHNVGVAQLVGIGFINNGGVQPCDVVNQFYCVEQ